MHIGIVSDEVSGDFERAVSLCTRWGVNRFELRRSWDKRFPNFNGEELERIKSIREHYDIKITAVSPGIFKTTLLSEDLDYHRTTLLENTMNMAEELEVDRIIIFGIERSQRDEPDDLTKVIDIIGETALKAGSRGFQVLMENEPGWWADTSKNTHTILTQLEDTGLMLNWDPGNLFNTGEEDYREGYELLKGYIRNVHVKDPKRTDGKNVYVPVGEGDIDWRGQLLALKEDGYTENIVVETHCRPKEESSKRSIEYVRRIIE